MVEELLHYFCCFECNRLFAIRCVKGCSKHVSSVVAAARYCNLTPCRFHPFSKHPRGGTPQVPKECVRKESKTLLSDSFRTLLRLRGALFRGSGGPAPGGLFRDSFRTLLRARETLCRAGPFLKLVSKCPILSAIVLFCHFSVPELSGPLNRDWRYYNCDTPQSAMPSREQLEL